MSKSKKRDLIYLPVLPNGKPNPKYNRYKHSTKLKFEAEAKYKAGEITKRQYTVLMNKAEKVKTGYFEDNTSYTKTMNKAQFVQKIVNDSKKSVLSTDLEKRQLPLSEREKLANKKAIATLAVQLFRRDYPNASLRHQDKSVQHQYLRRAKYIIKNDLGIKRVQDFNPNAVKPLESLPKPVLKNTLENKRVDEVIESVPIQSNVPTQVTKTILPKVTKASLWAEIKATYPHVNAQYILEHHNLVYKNATLAQLHDLYYELAAK